MRSEPWGTQLCGLSCADECAPPFGDLPGGGVLGSEPADSRVGLLITTFPGHLRK